MTDYRRRGGRTRLRVGGNMTPQGADRAGTILAVGGLLVGFASVVAAIAVLLRVLM